MDSFDPPEGSYNQLTGSMEYWPQQSQDPSITLAADPMVPSPSLLGNSMETIPPPSHRDFHQQAHMAHETVHAFHPFPTESEALPRVPRPIAMEELERNIGFTETDEAELTSTTTDELLHAEFQAFRGNIHVHTTLPPARTDVNWSTKRDPLVKDFLDRFEAAVKAYNAIGLSPSGPMDPKTVLEARAKYYETFKGLYDEWTRIWKYHFIESVIDADKFTHRAKLWLATYVADSAHAQSATNSKAKIKGYDKGSSVFLVRDPAPCSPKAKKAIGPYRFSVVLKPSSTPSTPVIAPDIKLTKVRAVRSDFADMGHVTEDDGTKRPKSASQKEVLPYVTAGKCTSRLVENSGGLRYIFEVETLSFNSTSNGCSFEVEFTISVYQGSTIEDFTVRSCPLMCVSNIGSQWWTGEGVYVAWLAFGGIAPSARLQEEIPTCALLNALQFAHLTCTRQIGSAYFIEKLEALDKKADAHAKRLRIKFDSGRSKEQAQHREIYNSFTTHNRAERFLTREEMHENFRPTGVMMYDHPTHGRIGVESITFEEFCKNWEWWGKLMYNFYTGQDNGFEPRHLWLKGLIHIAGPRAARPICIINPDIHPPGTALVRTSSSPGDFTYVAVTEIAPQFIAFDRLVVTGNDYATSLLQQAGIINLLNISGVFVAKTAFISAYRAILEAIQPRGDVFYFKIPALSQASSTYSTAPQTPAHDSF